MSKPLINQYYADLERIINSGDSSKETAIRTAFQNLLNQYCQSKEFQLIPKLDYKTRNSIVYPDGTVKDALRLDWGYWENQNRYDNLDREIEKKLAKGYPNSNILFENSQTAVLIQAGSEVMRVPMQDGEALDRLINCFINYIRPEVKDFRAAIETFKQDLPTILNALRDMIDRQQETSREFREGQNKFWEICKTSINPEVTLLDVREMMIQHILTQDIFINIFNQAVDRENNIARELQQVIDIFFTGSTKKNLLGTIERYYGVIKRTAANIYNHHEKQKFLKAVYENFYKAYNPQTADRLGIVYTPNEIVCFMIESVDFLTYKHFEKNLADKDVEILDPATGTGTFITELIEYLPQEKLAYKYQHEIHANEVAILAYYIANLNIEFTYKQKMGEYQQFENICFVDTLEHTYFHGKKLEILAVSIENTERIKRQNERTISVIIGNPPYNANRVEENDNHKNRQYPEIDKRIKDTYIKQSTAQKTKLYDMYVRFVRWATDRLGKNGIVAFVSNRSFIDSRSFDGFRKVLSQEFNEIYIIDMKGNARTSGERRRRNGGNIFNDTIKVGIAVYFLIRNENNQGCKIYYNAVNDYAKVDKKQSYLSNNKFQDLQFQHLIPNRDNNWIDIADNDFDNLLPLVNKDTKLAKNKADVAVFKLFSLGVITARDEWVYAHSKENLEQKIRYLIDIYNQDVENYFAKPPSLNQDANIDLSIDWTRAVKNNLLKGKKYTFDQSSIKDSLYRPFVKRKLYFNNNLNEMQYQLRQIFNNNQTPHLISFTAPSSSKPFMSLATNMIPDYHLSGDSQCLSLYYYDKQGNRIDNITDWGLEQFKIHYHDNTISKEDIFHYTYAVLHNPAYRIKYELNLKRSLPRLPFYVNFNQWVNWGKQLMDLHINYETVEVYPLTRIDFPLDESRDANHVSTPKVRLKADKDKGMIILDDITRLSGIPKIAWEYCLSNRSALEWILEQYKEKKPKDPTVAAQFNTYRFADYKEQIIDLLQRVCTVSVETIKIIQEMES